MMENVHYMIIVDVHIQKECYLIKKLIYLTKSQI